MTPDHIAREREAFEAAYPERQPHWWIREKGGRYVAWIEREWQAWSRRAECIPDGYALVPIQPTEAMIRRAEEALGALDYQCDDADPWFQIEMAHGTYAPECVAAYRAMITASQSETAPKQVGER